MTTKTDAVVIKSMRFRETSKIVTLYTRRFGKIKGIAKGARSPRSKFGASLEPMTQTALVLYKKDHREIHLISQSDVLNGYKAIHSDIGKMAVGLSILELVDQSVHSEESNEPLFTLLVETLDALDRAARNYENLLHAFELRLAALFGFAPRFDVCIQCGNELGGETVKAPLVFDLGKGGLYCDQCGRALGTAQQYGRRFAPMSTVKIMERFFGAKLDSVCSVDYPVYERNALDETLRLYLQYHMHELKPLKAMHMFGKLGS